MDVESIDDYKIPETEDGILADKIKVTISGVYDQFKAFKKTAKYKELTKSGIKVVFKPKKLEKKQKSEKQEQIIESDETDFNTILSSIISNEKNPYLFQAYQLVVNNKEVYHDDVMFL